MPAVHTRVQGPPPALPPARLCRYSVRLPQLCSAARSRPAQTRDASSCDPQALQLDGLSPTMALYSWAPTPGGICTGAAAQHLAAASAAAACGACRLAPPTWALLAASIFVCNKDAQFGIASTFSSLGCWGLASIGAAQAARKRSDLPSDVDDSSGFINGDGMGSLEGKTSLPPWNF